MSADVVAAARGAVPVLEVVGVVDGDSVPMRDLRAAVRGVMFKVNGDASSLFGDGCLTKGSLFVVAGDFRAPPASLGVNGLFVDRKLELRVGVNGLPFCRSGGMLENRQCVSHGECECSSICRRALRT